MIPTPLLATAASKYQAGLRTDPTPGRCGKQGANELGVDNRDVYYDAYGYGFFYEKQEAFDAYDARLSAILNYKGATSGKVWKEWSDAILSFNLQVCIRSNISPSSLVALMVNSSMLTKKSQNEPMTPDPSACKNGDAHNWLCGRAGHLRQELGADNPILVSTGGVGGDISNDCTFISAVTDCDAVDLISIHRYAGYPGNWAGSAPGYVEQANGKLVYVEEWGVNTTNVNPAEGFPHEAADMNSVGLPALYWQFLPDAVSDCPYNPSTDSDPFGIFVGGGTDIDTSLKNAASSPALQQGWDSVIP